MTSGPFPRADQPGRPGSGSGAAAAHDVQLHVGKPFDQAVHHRALPESPQASDFAVREDEVRGPMRASDRFQPGDHVDFVATTMTTRICRSDIWLVLTPPG